ncbi:trans-sialidase [Trypanosoma theileri]|uniref:Trans-sialidase n=1 Tax=Trypanosoma theileri TaxID=67003 RepID=A0A1X0P8G9_9TRYP|nr:trans-sialidase [Trypanosoma theileri]ORC93212.1 trans-sialidase [Trypanosoma theileri]
MELMLAQEVGRAAQYLKIGNHGGAENVIRTLQEINDPLVVTCTVNILNSEVLPSDSDIITYAHFIAFRLLKYYLIRKRDIREDKKDLLVFFFNYVEKRDGEILSPAWRSVLSEVALTMAVVLKLSCVNAEGGVSESSMSEMILEIISILDQRRCESQVVFIRHLVLHIVEEFGLYHSASRGRGMSVEFHRACRSLFECSGLVRFLHSLVNAAAIGISETHRTVEILLTSLNSIMSWSVHRFFEEDASEDESDHSLRVSGELWQSLLLEGVLLSGTFVQMDDLLRMWYTDGGICGFSFNRRSIVELIRQFCSVTMQSWSFSDRLNYGKRFLALTCFVATDILKNVADEDARTTLPLAISGVVNIVENMQDIFTDTEIVSFCVLNLSSFAKTLIEIDKENPDDESIMAALDENLSCLFEIASITSQNNSITAENKLACIDVLNTFLSAKLSYAHSSDETEHFSDTFTTSHISLLGHIGRLDPERATESFSLALDVLRTRYLEMGRISTAECIQVQEALWIVLKLIDAFIADACDGETVLIPSCFTSTAWSEHHPVQSIIMKIMIFLQDVMQNLPQTSPAVVSGLLEVLGTFISVYSVTENYGNNFFTQNTTTLISFVFYSLRVFTFEESVGLSGCRVLESSLKSKGMISILQSSEVLQAAEDMILCGQQFFGNVRGRIAAFWIRSVTHERRSEKLLTVLHSFDIRTTDFASIDVDICLERCATLSGFFLSMQESEELILCLDIVMEICNHLLSLSINRFYEKELMIQSTDMTLQLFLSCSAVLNGKRVDWIIDAVRTTLSCVMKSFSEDLTWRAEEFQEQKHRLLKLLSHLLCEVSRWQMMECDSPENVFEPLGSSVISSLAALLRLFDARSLGIPELQESVFLAFQLCAEAFVSQFVAYSDSQVFLSTLFFSLNSESIDIQRVGTTVTERVVSFLGNSSVVNEGLFSRLLLTIMNSFVLGRLSRRLSSQLAESIVTLCSCLSVNAVDEVLKEVIQSNPNQDILLLLEKIMLLVKNCLLCTGPSRRTALSSLTGAIAEGLGNIKGGLLV